VNFSFRLELSKCLWVWEITIQFISFTFEHPVHQLLSCMQIEPGWSLHACLIWDVSKVSPYIRMTASALIFWLHNTVLKRRSLFDMYFCVFYPCWNSNYQIFIEIEASVETISIHKNILGKDRLKFIPSSWLRKNIQFKVFLAMEHNITLTEDLFAGPWKSNNKASKCKYPFHFLFIMSHYIGAEH
jgi:hypothetical protein